LGNNVLLLLLLQGFNTFLPEGYKIDLHQLEEMGKGEGRRRRRRREEGVITGGMAA